MKILDFLLKNPILLFVIGAWLIGVISNVLKKSDKARRSRAPSPSRPAEQAQLPGQAQRTLPQQSQRTLPQQSQPTLQQQQQSIPSQAQPMPPRTPIARPNAEAARPVPAASGAKSAEEIAREMRRLLGLEPAESTPAPRSTPPPVRRPPVAPPVERPPQPITISTRDRKLDLHVEPHVGDGIRDRHLDRSRGQAGRKQPMGNLGGRVVEHAVRRRTGSRFALDDLKRAIVLSEILAPPVSLRPFDERRGH